MRELRYNWRRNNFRLGDVSDSRNRCMSLIFLPLGARTEFSGEGSHFLSVGPDQRLISLLEISLFMEGAQ
jgi:hypothetical protein